MQLTDYQLNIPKVVAARYQRFGDFEEMVSEGNLALVEAVGKFDPARHKKGEGGLSTYLFQAVTWRVQHYLRQQNQKDLRLVKYSLDERARELGIPMDELVASPEVDEVESCPLVDREDVARALQSLPCTLRTAARMAWLAGYEQKEVARRMGVSKQRVCQLMEEATARVRSFLLGQPVSIQKDQYNYKTRCRLKPMIDQQLSRRAALRLVEGKSRQRRYYLANHAHKALYGEWSEAGQALAHVGVTLPEGSYRYEAACLGWPHLYSDRARLLDALCRQGGWTTLSALVTDCATGLCRTSIHRSLGQLRELGYVERKELPYNVAGNWRATDLAWQHRQQGTTLRVISCMRAHTTLQLTQQDYTILPAHLMDSTMLQPATGFSKGAKVTLHVPENARLHRSTAVVEELTEWGAHVLCPAAATGKFRALYSEMLLEGGGSKQPQLATKRVARSDSGVGGGISGMGVVSDETPVDLYYPALSKDGERGQAREEGYTGDFCDQCGGCRMRRNGSCLLCEDCGATSGCS